MAQGRRGAVITGRALAMALTPRLCSIINAGYGGTGQLTCGWYLQQLKGS